ncbi:MAG: hypothetical protein ABII18_10885 [bacterium]|nr:hypothetical protein [bacterium]MBU1918249.1 hypothetical protein [bacterium]
MLRSSTTLPYAFTAPLQLFSTPLEGTTTKATLGPAVLPRVPFAHKAPNSSDVSRIYRHLQAVQTVREKHPKLTFQYDQNTFYSLMGDDNTPLSDVSQDVLESWPLGLTASMRFEELFSSGVTVNDITNSFDPQLSGCHIASLSIKEVRDNIWSLKLVAKYNDTSGEHIATYEVDYDIITLSTGQRSLHKRSCKIDVHKGKGIGKGVIAKNMQFNRDNPRVHTYEFQATDIGRYAWRHCELPFDTSSRMKIQKALHCLNDMLELDLDNEIIDNIRTPRDVAMICNMREAFEDIAEQVEIISTIYQIKRGFPFKPLSLSEEQIDYIAQFPGILALLMVDKYNMAWTPETKDTLPAQITL